MPDNWLPAAIIAWPLGAIIAYLLVRVVRQANQLDQASREVRRLSERIDVLGSENAWLRGVVERLVGVAPVPTRPTILPTWVANAKGNPP